MNWPQQSWRKGSDVLDGKELLSVVMSVNEGMKDLLDEDADGGVWIHGNAMEEEAEKIRIDRVRDGHRLVLGCHS